MFEPKRSTCITPVVNPIFGGDGLEDLFCSAGGATVLRCPHPDCKLTRMFLGSVDTEDLKDVSDVKIRRLAYLRFACHACGRELSVCFNSRLPESTERGEILRGNALEVSWAYTGQCRFAPTEERRLRESSAATGFWALCQLLNEEELPVALVEGTSTYDVEAYLCRSDDPGLRAMLAECRMRTGGGCPIGQNPEHPTSGHFFVRDVQYWLDRGDRNRIVELPVFRRPLAPRKERSRGPGQRSGSNARPGSPRRRG